MTDLTDLMAQHNVFLSGLNTELGVPFYTPISESYISDVGTVQGALAAREHYREEWWNPAALWEYQTKWWTAAPVVADYYGGQVTEKGGNVVSNVFDSFSKGTQDFFAGQAQQTMLGGLGVTGMLIIGFIAYKMLGKKGIV
jgi:hypothetical protein